MDFISQIIDEVVESVVEERWLPVTDYEGLYEVSDLGRIRGLKSGKILVCENMKNGYVKAHLWNKTAKNFYIHRLVLQAFQPTEEDLVCDHENHIRNDNRLVNLRWATYSQNLRYRPKREGLTSQYLGVYKPLSRKRWRARCLFNGKTIHIGCFDTEEEGAKAYNDFVIKHNLQDFNILNEIN